MSLRRIKGRRTGEDPQLEGQENREGKSRKDAKSKPSQQGQAKGPGRRWPAVIRAREPPPVALQARPK